MSGQQHANPPLFDAFVKAAQYIARLKSRQDVWEHLAQLVVASFPASWVAFARRNSAGEIELHHSTLCGEIRVEQTLIADVCDVIGEVLDSGFLASRIVAAPEPSMAALLPIAAEHEAKEVMLIGHATAEPLGKELLDVYLAVAGLASTALERLGNEQELIRNRVDLENLAKAVQAERQRFHDILEKLPVMICLLTPDRRMPFANRRHREFFGECEGRRCLDYTFHRREPCPECESLLPLTTGVPHRWELTTANGRRIEVHDFPFTDSDGSPLVLEMEVDITERKRMEEEVRASSLYARRLIEASLDPLVTISPSGQITDVNRATESATGVERDLLIGSDFSQYFTEPEKAREGYRRVLAEERVNDYPLTIRHANGTTTDVLYNATVYRDETGRVQGVFAAARDITERKATERRQSVTNALLELFAHKDTRREYLDSVVEVIRDWTECRCVGIRVADAEGNLPYASQVGFDEGFCQLGNDLSLNRDSCFCIRAVTEQLLAADGPARTRGGSFRCDDVGEFMARLPVTDRIEYRNNCVEGGLASLAVIPIRYREQTLGVIHLADPRRSMASPAKVEFIEAMSPLIGEAIHRFDAEAELRKYRGHLEELVAQRTEELARSNRDLEQFAYVASHDLQEPLRMVAGYLQLLADRYRGQLDEKAERYIGYAVDGAERMSKLIRDLLAFSRVNTRGDELRAVMAEDALCSAMKNLGSAMRESGASVAHDPLPAVRADSTQLAQLFQNLVGNAIKFRSQDRSLRVHVSAEAEGDEWIFRVRDNGIGFDQQYEEKMFLIFQRLHGRGQYPGTGIGLAICKRIVERHGGRIWASGDPGQGSTFFFTIPK